MNFEGGISSQFVGFEEALSTERFSAYLQSCEGDRDKALALYTHNTNVSAALYGPIQTLEITMRNRFHHHLTQAYGPEWYCHHGIITQIFQRMKIRDALLELASNKKPLEPGRVVASLTFGFWPACLSATYDNTLWRRGGLSTAFMAGGEKPKRSAVNRMLTPLRKLRNRIAHHEPILYYDLPKHHKNILALTNWLMPVSAEWCEAQSSFAQTYDEDLARLMKNPNNPK